MANIAGYLHSGYSQTMAGDGATIEMSKSGAWLVTRAIPGTAHHDAMAPYPFLLCRDWRCLAEDIDSLPQDLVSVTAVTDPFAETSEEALRQAFPHMVRPYKTHYVIDLRRPLSDYADPHHLGCARRALRKLEVEIVKDPRAFLGDWLRLYGNLVARHGIRGGALMSEEMFRRLFSVPGLTVFRAERHGATIGMIMCIDDGEKAYFHLGAYDDLGYRRNASYAIVHTAIEHFAAAGLAIMNIGAGAGAYGDGTDGLTAFKRGWASGSRSTYLCGRILNPVIYDQLAEQTGTSTSTFFPAYRSGDY